MIRLIAAVDRKLGIGKHGIIPWSIPEDEKYFTDMTKTHGGHVLTGAVTFRETYHGPLKDRHNYILSRDPSPIEGTEVINELEPFLQRFVDGDLWVAGGAAVFQEVMALGKADELYLTYIDADFGCDRFFPQFEGKFKQLEVTETREQNGFSYKYAKYTKI